jgi:hypothetical protein
LQSLCFDVEICVHFFGLLVFVLQDRILRFEVFYGLFEFGLYLAVQGVHFMKFIHPFLVLALTLHISLSHRHFEHLLPIGNLPLVLPG